MKNHKVVTFYSSVLIVLFSSSHDPGTDEPEEGSSRLICPWRMGDLVVFKSSFNFMRRYSVYIEATKERKCQSFTCIGKVRTEVIKDAEDLEIIAGKEGLF